MGAISKKTEIYNRNHINQVEMLRQVILMSESLLDKYQDFLTEAEIGRAKSLVWGIKMDYEYRNEFLVHILMNSYKVWDASHERYKELLQVVAQNDPTWLQSVMRDHDDKLRRCKVRVFPIGEARTA